MKNLTAVVCCGLLVLSLGCKAKEQLEKAAISADLAKRGTTDLLKETENDQYTAPADNRLTAAQIEMYLKVRQHEKEIAKVAKQELQKHADEAKKDGEKSLAGLSDSFKALGSLADVLTADIRAAKDLGYNTAEYRWIKERVLEASGAEMTAKIQQASTQMMDSAYAQTKKQYDEAKDEQTKKMLGEMLAGYDKSRQEMAQQSQQEAHIAYNRQLLSKYDGALNAIAVELSKFEDKEGEAEKSMQDFQKNLDKGVADAKAQAAGSQQ
jgi:hypothetical protein